jgi:arylsulfatase
MTRGWQLEPASRQVRCALVAFALFATAPASAELIRLEERLGEAEIVSPLRRIGTVSSLLEIPDVPSDRVFTRDYEVETDADRGLAGGCNHRDRPDGKGGAIVYRGRAPYRCVYLIAAEPSAHYTVRRSIHTDDTDIDFTVMESMIELRHPEVDNDPRDLERVLNGPQTFLARRTTLYTHRFTRPPRDRWHSDAIHLFTSTHTRTLVVMVADAQALLSVKRRTAWFDDLEVSRLKPRPAQELALFKGFGLAPGSDPKLGIAKHAQLLPVRGKEVEPPHDANYDFRHALFAPADTRMRFELQVPRAAQLSFSYALFKASRTGDSVRFRVIVSHAGRDIELFRRRLVLDAAGESWHWHEARVDLSAYAGERIGLSLETTAPPGRRGYALWGTPRIDTRRRAGDPPSVLVIAVDTLRADRLSTYGYSRNTSPHIDALAADAVRFERAVSSSNWTAPSFASLFTGLVPSQHLVVHRTRSIPPEIPTIGKYFRDAGWLTRGINYKAYLYNMGFEQGFDTWFGVPAASSNADPVSAKALQWLRDHGDRRFFLFVHYNDPHQPFNQNEDFVARFGSRESLKRLGLELPIMTTTSGVPKDCPSCAKNGEVVDAYQTVASDLYDGEVAFLDDHVGRLIDFLKRRRLYDDTIVVFVADHGESIYERGNYFGHGGEHFTDEVVRVPLIIKPHRGFGAAPGVVRQQVRQFDLMPTLLELSGAAAPPTGISAQSLLPALRDPAAGIRGRVAVSESVRLDIVAIAKRGWKYTIGQPPGEPSVESLFHFDSDPGETLDVFARHSGVVAELRADAMDHLLRHRAGTYLLLIDPGPTSATTIDVEANEVRSARTVMGLALEEREDGRFEFAGPGGGGLVLLAHFRVSPETRFLVDSDALHASQYEPGFVQRALRDGKRHVRLFRTEPSRVFEEPRADDPGQLEALKALGYVE